MATVRQSGGDYSSLNSALAASESVIDIDQAWTVDDTTAATFGADSVITISGAAKHPGYWDTAQDHYRLVVTGSHALRLVGAYSATIDGIAIQLADTGNTRNVFVCEPDPADVVTIRKSLLWCLNNANEQDCIYTGSNKDIGTVNVSQCAIWNANRGGIHIQNGYSSGLGRSATINIDSCALVNNGRGGSDTNGKRGGGIYCSRTVGDRTNITINVHNTICLQNTAGNAAAADFNDDQPANEAPVWNVSYSIDGDGSIATDTDGGTGNLASRTATDNTSPGTGDWVVFEDITNSPFDFRLVNNAENDAQDAHATASAHGMTIPSTDIVGTSRPQNTNYDIGPFELVSSAASIAAIGILLLR